MAIEWQSSKEITCLSSDTKPANADSGTEAYETDTGKRFRLVSGTWQPTDVYASTLDNLINVDTTTTAPNNSDVLTYNSSSQQWVPLPPPGASGGEANTASNTGTVGTGIWKAKTGVNLEFYKINSQNNLLTIGLNGTDRVDLTVNQGNFSLGSIGGTISNTQITAAAGIPYSKLTLTGTIVNADIATAAAIAWSKIATSGAIVNADVNASAAIAYSKLNLAGSIVNADISSSAAITDAKLAQITDKAKLPSTVVYTTDTQTLSGKTIQGLVLNVGAKTANYTATATDDYIPCSPAANMTITLPAAASSTGKRYTIQKINSNAFTVTIDPNSAELINGASTLVLATQYQGCIIDCDGSAWYTMPNLMERTGTATATANGTDTIFNIAHGLGATPYNCLVVCSSHTNVFTYTSNNVNTTVTFSSAPSATPTSTITFHWRVVL